MDFKPVSFVSKNKIEGERQNIREARQIILAEAEEKCRRLLENEERRKERGEDKWMLPSVEERLNKSKKKHKKEKKKKKKKHKKKSRRSDSESDSNSDQCEWVESTSNTEPLKKRDDWMVLPPSLFSGSSRQEIKAQQNKQTDKDQEKQKETYEPGKSTRELNPYWKDGGTGLPEQKPIEPKKNAVGDGGLAWLKRAYKRVEQQAKESGKSMEEVAAQRWGSLGKLEKLIKEAEVKLEANIRSNNQSKSSNSRDHRSSAALPRTIDRKEPSFMKPDIHGDKVHDDYRSKRYSRPDSSKGWRKKTTETEQRKNPRRESSSSSSSEQSDKEEPEAEVVREPSPVKILTEKEMNALGAQILKCEIMGQTAKAEKLKQQLEAARQAKTTAPPSAAKDRNEEETVILTRTDRRGVTRPLEEASSSLPSSGRRKKHKIDTHNASGERVRYFADDDKFSLKQMFEREKLGSAEDQNGMLSRLAAKGMETNDDMDDVMISRANKQQSQAHLDQLDRSRAIAEHRKRSEALSNCNYCFEGGKISKHLIIAIGMKAYLCVPGTQSLCEGHCYIVPMQHFTCSTLIDEDVWHEIQTFRKCLTQMFHKQDKVAVFFETNINPKRFGHMVIECVPMPKEIGDMAPIYFKKAIMESESEWSHNNKLVDLNKTDVKRAIPAGLAYFSVDFGMENGYAHVIEDQQLFPINFAHEIIGGMMDLEARLWRKPIWDKFQAQTNKVLQFAKDWESFDWTKNIEK